MDPIVIVGGGQAALAAAAKLRTLDDTCAITIVGEEDVLPYQRPPLSKKYLVGKASFDELLLRPARWYAERRIDVMTSTTVTAIDRRGKLLASGGGAPLSYGKLILATGARPRRWPDSAGGTLTGVYVARSKADVDCFAGEMRPGRRLLVVGGGYVGLEVAAVAATQGLSVTLIEADARILKRVAASPTAQAVRDLHGRNGVIIREGVGVVRFVGDKGRVARAELSDGTTLATDFVIVGIGVVPNDELALDSGLTVRNGILVDAHGRTCDPDIYAVGDCAAFPYRDETIRLECVQNAIDQAEIVARNIVGDTVPYRPIPWFWSDQYDTKLQIAGLNRGYTDTVCRRSATPGQLSVWYFSQDTLLAVDALNDSKAFVCGRKMLEAGLSPQKTLIEDPSTDLIGYIRAETARPR